MQLTTFSAIACYVTALLKMWSQPTLFTVIVIPAVIVALETHCIILLNMFWVVTMLQSSLSPMDRLASLSPRHCYLLFFIFYKGKLVWSFPLWHSGLSQHLKSAGHDYFKSSLSSWQLVNVNIQIHANINIFICRVQSWFFCCFVGDTYNHSPVAVPAVAGFIRWVSA